MGGTFMKRKFLAPKSLQSQVNLLVVHLMDTRAYYCMNRRLGQHRMPSDTERRRTSLSIWAKYSSRSTSENLSREVSTPSNLVSQI